MDSLDKYDTLDVNVVSKALVQYVTSSMSGMGGAINNTLAELRVLVTSSFESQLQKQVREYRENVAQIQKSVNLSKNDIPQRRAALERQDTLLRQQMNRCGTLEDAVDAMEDTIGRRTEVKTGDRTENGMTGTDVTGQDTPTEMSYGFL